MCLGLFFGSVDHHRLSGLDAFPARPLRNLIVGLSFLSGVGASLVVSETQGLDTAGWLVKSFKRRHDWEG
jgi:hypothetical protein